MNFHNITNILLKCQKWLKRKTIQSSLAIPPTPPQHWLSCNSLFLFLRRANFSYYYVLCLKKQKLSSLVSTLLWFSPNFNLVEKRTAFFFPSLCVWCTCACMHHLMLTSGTSLTTLLHYSLRQVLSTKPRAHSHSLQTACSRDQVFAI